MEKTVCLLCGEENGRALLRRSTPRHVVCRRCGLVYQNPRPTLAEIADYYRQHYWEERGEVITDDTESRNEAYQDRVRAMVDWTRPLVQPQDLVIEIGCGHGEIISSVRDSLGCQVLGVEPSHAQAAAAAKRFGLSVIEASLDDFKLEGPSAKVLILSHVAEHFHDPRAAFVRCRDLLTDDGWILVEVPNILRPNPSKRLSAWLMAEHMYYFSQGTLSRVLEEAGFRVKNGQCADCVRMLAQRSAGPAEPRGTPVNEYRQVLRALWHHELKYWPKYVAQRVLAR